ncbi:putative membrane protein [Cylindrospermum stagnale PCC 7417]|uniref:Putative membrane protein n=1 Tax=Cylindrospermum stagnale PCC 7417 TaxID=56107 RepID=K9WWZ5_9NOST|nr:DUF1634 domain-containing protein [Cylindrospermum stagnale]AFZ24895.1 putative membrane protein [Cylindrospermum stagnale PCC 7417]
MYKFNSSAQWKSSAQPETEVVALALEPEDADQLKEQQVSTLSQIPNSCEIEVNQNLNKTPSEQQLEILLSDLLKYGVLIASAVVLLGGILYLIRHGTEPAEYQIFRGEPSEFRSPAGVVNAVLSGSRRGIIQLGLLILIATPVLRVIISLLTFLLQREFIYVIVTSLVLASLTYSLIGAYY